MGFGSKKEDTSDVDEIGQTVVRSVLYVISHDFAKMNLLNKSTK